MTPGKQPNPRLKTDVETARLIGGRLTGPTWAFICLAALGALLLLSAAFEQPVWVVALVLFFVER